MGEKLIFGSTALKYWFPDHPYEPKDLDYICKAKSINHQKGVEYHWCDGLQYVIDNNKHPEYADPDFLYTIKVSHAAWDVFWDKTMHHIIFLKDKGCKLDEKLYNILYKEWEVIHGRKKVKLNVENKDFFTKTIQREYDHDWLHEYLAFDERPMHERIRKDLNNPLCSKELWDTLNHQDKIKCALEETYVIATERYLDDSMRFKQAKIKSLKNLIVSATKGWFNLFLIENFKELYYNDIYDLHWISKIKELKYE